MKRAHNSALELPLEERAAMAFKAAVRKAIEARARKGLPVYVWHDGRVVALCPDEVLELTRNDGSD
jgi:hypothetical protein